MILLGKQASLTATRWKFMETVSGSGVSTRRKAVSYAAARTVCNIVVARRQQMTSTPSLPGVRLTARHLASIHMAGRSRPVRLMAPISANGLYAGAWRWIGLNTPKVDTAGLSRTPNAPVEESGGAVMSSHGCIAPVSGRTASRPPARMTQTPIPD